MLRGVKADSVLLDLDLAGIAASSGSACASLTQTPSHVLRAIGCTPDEADGSLCFTLGRWSTAADVDAVLDRLPRIVARLRALSARSRPARPRARLVRLVLFDIDGTLIIARGAGRRALGRALERVFGTTGADRRPTTVRARPIRASSTT